MRHGIKSVDVGGHRLRTLVEGRGEPTFLLLHGLVDSLEIWDRLAPGLSARGTVVRIDQRGHGGSDSPPGPYALADLARDAAGVLRGLGIDSAILVGHSMGGIVSLRTTVDFPDHVQGLVLLGTTSQVSERAAGWYETIARAGERDGRAGLAAAIYGKGPPREIRGDPGGIAHVTRALASLHPSPLTPRLAEVRSPSLVLVGDRDPMGGKASDILASRLPGARLEVFPGKGHWLHVEAPDETLGAIGRWLGSPRDRV